MGVNRRHCTRHGCAARAPRRWRVGTAPSPRAVRAACPCRCAVAPSAWRRHDRGTLIAARSTCEGGSVNGRRALAIAGLAALLLVGCAARLLVGHAGPDGALTFGLPSETIAPLRVGAIASAAAAGMCLGLSGLLLQALLRNPLAAPFILGLSAGAGLATTIAAWFSGAIAAIGLAWLANSLAGTVGALAVLAIVAALGRRSGVLDPLTLILAGTVISTICGALTLLVQSLMPPSTRGDSWTWFMGQVPEIPDWPLVWVAVALVALCAVVATRLGDELDAASTTDDEATSLGVSLGRLRIVLFTGAGALAAASVALCGPIAFVGFVAPHLARGLMGSRHGALAVASPLAGAAILVWADALRQGIDFGAGRLPIGVLTALLGGPVFLSIMRRSRVRTGGWSC
ncbi:MAG: iron ABC transporter permease [Phycisphaerales bacterium]|nr:iron ABC transporter permease [Phycisphaerales bacterium]